MITTAFFLKINSLSNSSYAVVTLCIGKAFGMLASLTHPLMRRYAKKCNADFIVIENKMFEGLPVHYEKYQLANLLKRYCRIPRRLSIRDGHG